jgi:hypothetical protein
LSCELKSKISEEVKIGGEAIAGHALVLLGIRADLVRVHANHGNLDRSRKIKVVVAQVICQSLKLILSKSCSVIHSLIQNRPSSGDSSLVRDHIEIKDLISLHLNHCSVNDCAIARIQEILIILHK